MSKDKNAQELGKKGGKSRAKKLSYQEKKKIAQKGAAARWGKKKKTEEK